MSTPSNSSRKSTPEEKLLVFFVISSIIGVIFACIFEFFIIRGDFQRWETVGRVPENTQEAVGGSPEKAYIRTEENKTLSCRLNNSDECWIPDVYDNPYYTEACDKKHVAFSPALHPPKDLISCIEINTGGGGYHYDVIYVIDHAGNLWQWENVREGGDTPLIMLIMIAGGFGGVLLGSIIWVIVRLFQIKKSTRENPLFSVTHIVLLVIPWLCLLSFLVLRFLTTYQFNR